MKMILIVGKIDNNMKMIRNKIDEYDVNIV